MRPKRVLLATTYQPNDTTSLLRAWGPFTQLQKEGECEIVQRPPDSARADWFRDWSYWFNVDVCYIHRPSNPSYVPLIKYAKLHNIPVWIDHDDDLLNITPDNPVYFNHAGGGDEYKEACEFSYREADILTCSGEPMFRDFIEKYGRSTTNTFFIDTGLDDRFLFLKKEFSMNQKIGWRGSKSHLIDLLFFGPGIHDSMKKLKDKTWYFWGINPFWTEWLAEGSKIQWVDQLNLYPYLHAITYQNCSIHMVPLVDTKFNRVKSNLSWLDATLAGSVTLGPDFEHFLKPGIFNYKSNDVMNFADKLQSLSNTSEETLRMMHELSWEFIRDNLMLSKLNNKRKEILRNL